MNPSSVKENMEQLLFQILFVCLQQMDTKHVTFTIVLLNSFNQLILAFSDFRA